jgi:hypothetical protein
MSLTKYLSGLLVQFGDPRVKKTFVQSYLQSF